MALFKIESQNIANDAIAIAQIDDSAYSSLTSSANTAYALAISVSDVANNIPRVSGVQIANSSYVILDDTAANTGGGYIVVSGSGFVSGCQVIIGDTLATSVSVIDSGTLHCQVPAKAAATYNMFVVNPNGSTAIGVNALTYSANPTWISSSLSDQSNATPFAITLSATGATSYALANGSSLPTGTTLLSNGYFYGTVTVETQTTYNFDIVATDDELQDSTRSFSLTVSLDSQWIRVLGSSGDNYAKTITIDTSENAYIGIDTGTYGSSPFNILMVSYDKQGNRRWEKYFSDIGGGDDYITGMSANNNQGLLLWNGDFVSGGYRRGMLGAVHTSNGNIAWSRYYQSNASYNDFGGSITANNSYLWATFYTNVNFLFGNYEFVLQHLNISNGSQVGSIATGTYWNDGTNGFDACRDITNYGDYVYGAGMRGGNRAFAGKWSKNNNGSVPLSTTAWGREYYSAYVAEEMTAIAVDTSENVYATGNTAETIGTYHFAVSKWNSSGALQWHKTLRAASYPTGVCVDAVNDVYVQYSDQTANNCVGIMKLDSSGNIVWQRRIKKTGVAIQGKGLKSQGNVIIGIAQVQSTPKSVMIFKIKTDGSGTGTYNDYIYEATGYSLTTPTLTDGSLAGIFASYGNVGGSSSYTNQNTSPQLTETVVL